MVISNSIRSFAGLDLRDRDMRISDWRNVDFAGANLHGVSFYGSDVRGANFRGASMSYTTLDHTDLSGAIFEDAILLHASLRGVKACGVNFKGANLRLTTLSQTDFDGADFTGASMERASLRESSMLGAKLPTPLVELPPVGEAFTAWKKINTLGMVLELLIPAEAQRVSTPIGFKCRASEALVVRAFNSFRQEVEPKRLDLQSCHDRYFFYKVGEVARPHMFDPNPVIECAPGIHFFLQRSRAEEYYY
jgi:hypothetical protein